MPKKTVICATQVFLVLGLGAAQLRVPEGRAARVRILSGAEAPIVERIGLWPYGPCEASAVDSSRNVALIGNGETLQVLDIVNPFSPRKSERSGSREGRKTS